MNSIYIYYYYFKWYIYITYTIMYTHTYIALCFFWIANIATCSVSYKPNETSVECNRSIQGHWVANY